MLHTSINTGTVSVNDVQCHSCELCCRILTWDQLQEPSSRPLYLKHSPKFHRDDDNNNNDRKPLWHWSFVTWLMSVSILIHVNVQFVHKVVHAPDSLVFLYFDGTGRVMLPLSFFFIFLWRVPWRRYDRIWVSFEITMSLVVRVVWAWKTTPSKLNWDTSSEHNWDFTSQQHWDTTKSQCYWGTTEIQHIHNTSETQYQWHQSDPDYCHCECNSLK